MPTAMRVVMALAVAGALAVAIAWIDADMEAWAENTILTMDEPEERQAVVKSGDTLWSIASTNYPGEHTGKMVYEIRQANPGIDPGRLQIGQVVVLP